MTSIARNTSYFTLALILQKLISLTYFTLYARALGPADLGQYYFALSVTSIFGIFIDLGFGNVLTREIAKHPEKATAYISSALGIKTLLSLGAIAILLLWTNAWDYSDLTRDLIYISALASLIDNVTGIFYSALRGFHNLKFESIASVVFQVIVLIFSLVVLKLDADLRWLMLSLVVGSLFNVIYSGAVCWRVLKLQFRLAWDKAIVRHLWILVLPFAIFAIFQRFYTYFDSVLLFKLAGDRAVGIYQIPFKIVVALQFLPMAFTASLYPALSAYWQRNREQLSITFERAINYSLILSVPITLGTIVLADKIILLFKEGFNEAIWPLQVSIIAVPFMFLGFPVGSLLNACDRQKQHTTNMIITSLISAVLNIILIPSYGVLGACITTVLTSILMLALGWRLVPKVVTVRAVKVLKTLGAVALAGGVMAGLTYLLKPYLQPVVVIAIAALVYAVVLYLGGGFKKEDVMSVYRSFIKEKV